MCTILIVIFQSISVNEVFFAIIEMEVLLKAILLTEYSANIGNMRRGDIYDVLEGA